MLSGCAPTPVADQADREGGSPQEQHRGVGRDQDGHLPSVHAVRGGPAVGKAQPDGAEPDDQGGADTVQKGVSDPSEDEGQERGDLSPAEKGTPSGNALAPGVDESEARVPARAWMASRNPFPPNSGTGLLPKMRPMHPMKAGANRSAKMTVTGSRSARIAVTRHS